MSKASQALKLIRKKKLKFSFLLIAFILITQNAKSMNLLLSDYLNNVFLSNIVQQNSKSTFLSIILSFTVIFLIFILIIGYVRQKKNIKFFHIENKILLEDAFKKIETCNTKLYEYHNTIEEKDKNLAELNNQLFTFQRTINRKDEELKSLKEHLDNLVNERTSELEAALKKAEESDMLKSAFLSNMSHEIRTPLNAIMGFISLLIQDELSIREKIIYERIIYQNSKALQNLINDILDISKIESGELHIYKELVNVNDLIDELTTTFNKVLSDSEKHNIELIAKYPAKYLCKNSPIIFTDLYRIKQILSNLLDNALKYTEKGKIELGYNVEIDDDHQKEIVFYVEDTGMGIPAEEMKNIFERFRKIEPETNKVFRGVGLGLSIAINLADLLHAKIWVESTYNVGSIFYFSIQMHGVNEISQNRPIEKVKENFNWFGKSILVVEDEECNFFFIKNILKHTQVNVLYARDGSESIRKFRDLKPNLVLMDIKIPLISGEDAMKIMKNEKPDIPIIAQTAYALANQRHTYIESGFDGYISKPFSKVELLKEIDKHLS